MNAQREILNGIPNKDFRDAVSDMMKLGWSVQRTGKSHLRLTHILTKTPIFASGTPSDFRASQKLRSQCRRALRISDEELSETAPRRLIDEINADDAPRRRRKEKGRWDAEQRALRLSAPARPLSEDALPNGVFCENKNNDKAVEEMTIDAEVAAKPETKARSVRPAAKSAPKKPRAAAKPRVAPPATSGPAPTLPLVPGDLLMVAMRILSGDLTSMVVTPDMVGKTVVLGGEGWLVDADLSAFVAGTRPGIQPSCAVSPTPRPTTGTTPEPSQLSVVASAPHPMEKSIVEALKLFPGNDFTAPEIASMVDNTVGNSPTAHAISVRKRIYSLVDSGAIAALPTGIKCPKFTYRLSA